MAAGGGVGKWGGEGGVRGFMAPCSLGGPPPPSKIRVQSPVCHGQSLPCPPPRPGLTLHLPRAAVRPDPAGALEPGSAPVPPPWGGGQWPPRSPAPPAAGRALWEGEEGGGAGTQRDPPTAPLPRGYCTPQAPPHHPKTPASAYPPSAAPAAGFWPGFRPHGADGPPAAPAAIARVPAVGPAAGGALPAAQGLQRAGGAGPHQPHIPGHREPSGGRCSPRGAGLAVPPPAASWKLARPHGAGPARGGSAHPPGEPPVLAPAPAVPSRPAGAQEAGGDGVAQRGPHPGTPHRGEQEGKGGKKSA